MSNQPVGWPEKLGKVVPLMLVPRGPARELADREGPALVLAPQEGHASSAGGLRCCASVPLIRRRSHIAVQIGTEKRRIERIAAEAHAKSWLHSAVSLSAVSMFAATLVMSTLATAYLLKSVLGFDLFEDNFFMHGWFFM